MKKFITILTGCSLALAVGVQAEQLDPKKKPAQKPKPVQRQQIAPKQHMAPKARVQPMPQHQNPTIPNARIQHSNVPKPQIHTAPAIQSNKLHAVQPSHVPVVKPNTLPAMQPNRPPTVQSNKLHANAQTVKTFHPRNVNFHATPNRAIVSATFNHSYRIRGAQNWNGTHYNAFRTYRPQWHDQGWWHSHHNHILLIGGGWYYWNAGYWYPAWGYDNSAAYYPYDGPIYVGNSPTPLDQVVADVQTSLQEQGYYHGEVDGLVGPLTQEALAAYQSAQGLEPTAAIDEPTLESLGIS